MLWLRRARRSSGVRSSSSEVLRAGGGRLAVVAVVVMVVGEGGLRGLRAAVRSWMLCFLARGWCLGGLVRWVVVVMVGSGSEMVEAGEREVDELPDQEELFK